MRDPTSFLEVIAQMLASGEIRRDHLIIRFRGPKEFFLTSLVIRLGLDDVVDVQPTISRPESLRLQAESQLLLSLELSDPKEQGFFTGKIFEYLGSRRPIISVGNKDAGIGALLRETKAGAQAGCKEHLRSFLLAAYQEYRNTGQVSYSGDAAVINCYTHREMSARFARILHYLGHDGTYAESNN